MNYKPGQEDIPSYDPTFWSNMKKIHEEKGV